MMYSGNYAANRYIEGV